MKATIVFSSCLVLVIAGYIVLHNLESYSKPIFIESLESKNLKGQPVINAISYSSENGVETWSMRQNHHDGSEWDDLKIVVDKNYSPAKARYFQLENGVEKEFRVSCFSCHANGPRLIRANNDSDKVKNSLYEKAVMAYWNLRIKHYGAVDTPQDVKLLDEFRKIPLKYEGRVDKKIVELESCNLCHGEDSILGRSDIQFQHQATIKYLVESGAMPPLFFKVSNEDKEFLRREFLITVP